MNNKYSNLQVSFKLISLVKPLIVQMIFAVLTGFLGHIAAIFIPVFGAIAILQVLGIATGISLKTIFIITLVLALVRGVFRYIEQTFNHYIAFKLLAILRDKVFRALRVLTPAKLETKDKGNLISIITSDIELLEVFYAHTISPIMIAILVFFFMIVLLAQFSFWYALIAAVAYIRIGFLLPYFFSKNSGTDGAEFRHSSGKLSSFVLDSLRGMDEVIQFGLGEKRLHGIDKRTKELLTIQKSMKDRQGGLVARTGLLIFMFDIMIILTAVYLYKNGSVGYMGVLIPVIAFISSFGPFVSLSNLGSGLENTFASGNRILEILEEEPVTRDITDGVDIVFDGAGLENVRFSYGEELILDNVSMNFEKGKVVGINGKSGSGKSTILKLLMRFWDTNSGKVSISSHEINKVNTKSLRDTQSYITQETHLFNDTIANNIKIAKPDASMEEIISAAKKASIHDFISSLPKGYDSNVGELGSMLSGGERQRLGLARAFLNNADFMLMDEPTSNLDSLNEAIILKSIDEEKKDKTVVLVSHRKSTMKICDDIYEMSSERLS